MSALPVVTESRSVLPVGSPAASLAAAIEAMPLVDHHVHGAATAPLDVAALAAGLTESPFPAAPGTSYLDSQLGFAVRRWCAPVLDLPPHVDAGEYAARRAELGVQEVTRRLLRASGIALFLVETGYRAREILAPSAMAAAAGAQAAEVVRLEAVAEDVAGGGTDAAGFAGALAAALHERARTAVGLKSVIAYRYGLDFEPEPPTAAEVRQAAGTWLRAGGRVTDPVLLRHLLWAGVETGLPLQFHVGLGDPDLTMHRTDPSLMTEFVRRVRVPVLLLHCYPHHRTAAYLASVFPHVHMDVGLAVNFTGARSRAVVAESLEVAPFGKVLFSSDAFGPPELHHLGALLWRRAMTSVLGEWVADGDWSHADAVRVAGMVGAGNARRVYGLEQV
ncbi:amidohydrolase family protein [Pseudonocardia aurantiaca]